MWYETLATVVSWNVSGIRRPRKPLWRSLVSCPLKQHCWEKPTVAHLAGSEDKERCYIQWLTHITTHLYSARWLHETDGMGTQCAAGSASLARCAMVQPVTSNSQCMGDDRCL